MSGFELRSAGLDFTAAAGIASSFIARADTLTIGLGFDRRLLMRLTVELAGDRFRVFLSVSTVKATPAFLPLAVLALLRALASTFDFS